MHIDARIKANQAATPLPHCPSPIQPSLCSSLKAWAPDLPSWQTLEYNNDWGSFCKFGSPLSRQLYPVEYGHSSAYWFQNRCSAQLEWSSAGCKLTNFALNTNTDGRKLCVTIPYVPEEYIVTYQLNFSLSCQQAPHVLSLWENSSKFVSLCLTANRCKPKGSNSLWGLTSGVTLTSCSLFYLSQRVPAWAWKVEEKREGMLCTTFAVMLCVRGDDTCLIRRLINMGLEEKQDKKIRSYWKVACMLGKKFKVYTCACLSLCTTCVKQLNAGGRYVSLSSPAPHVPPYLHVS